MSVGVDAGAPGSTDIRCGRAAGRSHVTPCVCVSGFSDVARLLNGAASWRLSSGLLTKPHVFTGVAWQKNLISSGDIVIVLWLYYLISS